MPIRWREEGRERETNCPGGSVEEEQKRRRPVEFEGPSPVASHRGHPYHPSVTPEGYPYTLQVPKSGQLIEVGARDTDVGRKLGRSFKR